MAQVRKPHPNQLELNLFPNTQTEKPHIMIHKNQEVCDSSADVNEELESKLTNDEVNSENAHQQGTSLTKSSQNTTKSSKHKIKELFLPFTYEDILTEIGEDKSRLPDLIVPVTKFEEQIIQVVADIKNSGFLMFLYGVSGVGKSTFISSLKFPTYIPVKEIVSINAGKLIQEGNSGLKLKELIKKIQKESSDFFSENNKNNDKLRISIEYLESLEDEDDNHVRAFFRDLNALLRQYPILIIWSVIDRRDLENMQDFAKSFSSTMFHTRIPFIDFTGPPFYEYPNIAKKTIMFFNEGKSCYEFQLNDNDFENLKKEYESKPRKKHLIRDYLKDIRSLWEERTNYISRIVETVPKPTEVWFIFSYPEAEGVVAGFAKKTPDIINEMWNADYKALNVYISENNQRKADWKPQRLTLALSSRMLTTKIMYLPTNALVSCIAAYAKDAQIPISKEDLLNPDKYNIAKHWFQKRNAKITLKTTPLYLQILGVPITGGKRKSGTVKKGLENAKKAFEKINEDISRKNISDQKFNQAICLALQDVFRDSEHKFDFVAEKNHPYLTNIRPDILVDTGDKLICLEFCYTNNNTPGNIADYVLRKLNKYMKQLEENFGISFDKDVIP